MRGTELTKQCTWCWQSPSFSDTHSPMTITSSGQETSTPSTLSCSTCASCSFTSSKRDLVQKSLWFVEWYSLLCFTLTFKLFSNLRVFATCYNSLTYTNRRDTNESLMWKYGGSQFWPSTYSVLTVPVQLKIQAMSSYRRFKGRCSFLPRCMKCRRGIAMRILSVRLSVCPSVRPSHAWSLTTR